MTASPQPSSQGRLVAVVGPTGIGKSDLALALAERFHGEIVGADSRQVYRCMDIGTAKPTPAEKAGVPHHLFDIATPDQDFSVALYQTMATQALDDIWRRGRLPFLVGGNGHYVKVVVGGLEVPRVPPDRTLRQRLEERASEEGPEQLHADLAAIDPVAAGRIHPHNVRRTVRALEVWYKTGKRFSDSTERRPPAYDVLTIALTAERAEVYRRIDARVEAMVAAGWLDEVRRLLDQGYDFSRAAFSGHGYRELAAFVRGELDLETAKQRAKYIIHRYVRTQYAWFRRDDPAIHWFDIGEPDVAGQAIGLVEGWLEGRAAA